MLRHGLRLSAAILTFTIGITLVWTHKLVHPLEVTLVEDYFTVDDSGLPDISPMLVNETQDINQIYHLLIRERFTFRDTRLIVLQSETTGYPMGEDEGLRAKFGRPQTFHQFVKELIPEVDSKTLDNYLAGNKTRQPLLISDLGTNYLLYTETDVSNDDVHNFWTAFYNKYPLSSGLIFFSNVGFNEQHDQAFVYAGRSCGGLCGEGAYFLLQ